MGGRRVRWVCSSYRFCSAREKEFLAPRYPKPIPLLGALHNKSIFVHPWYIHQVNHEHNIRTFRFSCRRSEEILSDLASNKSSFIMMLIGASRGIRFIIFFFFFNASSLCRATAVRRGWWNLPAILSQGFSSSSSRKSPRLSPKDLFGLTKPLSLAEKVGKVVLRSVCAISDKQSHSSCVIQ
jgi:hypothetical protein